MSATSPNTLDSLETTIAAIATPSGHGGIAAIRLSGAESWQIAQTLCPGTPLKVGQIAHRWLLEPQSQDCLDEVLILPFKAPNSFTGEDVIEIHTHGGVALSRLVLSLCLQAGARPALPGEFSKRAVLNGRLDLSQAESILDLIHAEGEALIKASARNLKEATHAHWVHTTAEAVNHVQASMVASIDFPDEVDEPDRAELITALQTQETQLQDRAKTNQQRQVIRHGFQLAILGQPNAGKSSLFNALLDSNRAIVTDIAGTTRDTLQERLSISGIPITLIDTAGLRDETGDAIEKIGIEKSWEAAQEAHFILYLIDGTNDDASSRQTDTAILEKLVQLGSQGLILYNKSDEANFQGHQPVESHHWQSLAVSAKTGQGLTQVLSRLQQTLGEYAAPESVDILLSDREQELLKTVTLQIQRAIETLNNPALPLDLATVPLTAALTGLHDMLGLDSAETVLDSVFARFCVGK